MENELVGGLMVKVKDVFGNYWPKPHPLDWAMFKAGYWVDINLPSDDEWMGQVDQVTAVILGWA